MKEYNFSLKNFSNSVSNYIVQKAVSNLHKKQKILKASTITPTERQSLHSLESFCNFHQKLLFYGPEEVTQCYPKHLKSICIDDVSTIGKLLSINLNSTFINPLKRQLSLTKLIDEINSIQPNVIYLDWDLGDVFDDSCKLYDGGSVADELKKQHPSLIIILITGANRDELESRLKNPNVDGLLVFKKNVKTFLESYAEPSLPTSIHQQTVQKEVTLSSLELDQRQKDTLELVKASILRPIENGYPTEPNLPKPSNTSINTRRKTVTSQSLKLPEPIVL